MRPAVPKPQSPNWQTQMGVAYFLKDGKLYEGKESEMEEGQHFFVLSQTPTTPMNYEFVFMRRGPKQNNGEYEWYKNDRIYSSIDVEDFRYMYFSCIKESLTKLENGTF